MSENQKKNQDILIIAGFIALLIIAIVFWAMGQRNLASHTIDEENSNAAGTAIENSPANNPAPFIEAKTAEPQKFQNFPSSGRSIRQIISTAQTWQPVYQHLFGKEATDFALTDLNGKQHRLSDYRGKPVLLIFWATWCPPCRAEVPDLIKLRNRFSEDELVILAASDEGSSVLKNFISKNGINYTVLLDDGKLPLPFGFQRAYRNVGVPCSFIIDPQGNLKIGIVGVTPLSDIIDLLGAAS